MIETEMVSETLSFYPQVTWLKARENFIVLKMVLQLRNLRQTILRPLGPPYIKYIVFIRSTSST
jgi:hypothetical protein